MGGARIYLKREDLLHTGAHKINNCLGQALLARRMGKKRTSSPRPAQGSLRPWRLLLCAPCLGSNASSTWASRTCRRQRPKRIPHAVDGGESGWGVANGSQTLKDAISEAMRDWVTNVHNTYYLLGSALGAHPYPEMVREFHRVIGIEARAEILKREGRLAGCRFRLRRGRQ